MVELRRIGRRLGQLLVRGIQSVTALLLLLSLWALGGVPSGPNAPEQAGTFVWAFLFSWGFATFVLVVLVGVHLLVNGYRSWAAEDPRSLRRPIRRLAIESIIGAAIVMSTPSLRPSGGGIVFAAPAALAWTVLIHHAIDTFRYARQRVGFG